MEFSNKDKKKYCHCVAILRASVQQKKPITKFDLNEFRNTLGLDILDLSSISTLQFGIDSYIEKRIAYFTKVNRDLKLVEYMEIRHRNKQLFNHYLNHRSEYVKD